VQVGDEAALDRIATYEDDRYGSRRDLGCRSRWLATDRDDDRHFPTHEVSREFRKPVILTVGPSIIDGDVPTLDEADLIQTLPGHRSERRIGGGRAAAEQTDHWCRLLRASRSASALLVSGS